ncbi:hypothetical protein CLOM_g17808 [Closterium sp. NIES-68]|nr:hypothetical protein CLOM_g17808 [Closterium sp. NIES-68]GJP85020.1 hypothetical protein CLOP_g15057 [Closterium sp. NIES-67]
MGGATCQQQQDCSLLHDCLPVQRVSSAAPCSTAGAVSSEGAGPSQQNGDAEQRAPPVVATAAGAPDMGALRAQLQRSLAQSLGIRAAALDRMRAINERVERLRRIETEAVAARGTLRDIAGGGLVEPCAGIFRGDRSAATPVAAPLRKLHSTACNGESPRAVRRLSGTWSRPAAVARGKLGPTESEGSVTGSTCGEGEWQSAQSRRRLERGLVCAVGRG